MISFKSSYTAASAYAAPEFRTIGPLVLGARRKRARCLAVMAVSGALLVNSGASATETFVAALSEGEAYADFRLRYESVQQSNALSDAEAITLRSRLGYKTAEYKRFSAVLELEDSSPMNDSYNNANGRGAAYSVVADPESTEWDQAYIQYAGEAATVILGRQILALDNQRFIGHVGWRQDRQTFDGLSVEYALSNKLNLQLAYIDKRERIFAGDKDIESKDLLLNLSQTTAWGKLSMYAYSLEEDNALATSYDSYGIRLASAKALVEGMTAHYELEYAQQKFSRANSSRYSADYYHLSLGLSHGGVRYTLAQESLGSDAGQYGFSTPLATGHKFNGWTDQFLSTPKQGLRDAYASVSGSLLGGQFVLAFHQFEAEQSDATVDDLGEELQASYTRKISQHWSAGVKYASYRAGDLAAGKVDTDKLWLWLGLKL